MSNYVLTINVADVDAVLKAYAAIRLYRSRTGLTGPFEALTDATTDIPLAPGVTRYRYDVAQGGAQDLFRAAYIQPATGDQSAPSEPFGPDVDPALSVLSVQDLKDNFLLGLDLTLPDGTPIPDAFFERYIKAGVAAAETMLDMTLSPTVVTQERKDYIQREADQFFWTNLNRRPVQSVQAVRLRIPGAASFSFPAEWLDVQASAGVVQVVPRSALALTPTALGAGGTWSPMFMAATRRRIPNGIEVDYTAGFAPGQVPGDILEFVGKQASLGPLRTVGNLLLGPGIAGQSIGIDGLSQSVSLTKGSNGAFAAMVSDYQNDLAQMRSVLKGRYCGVRFRTV